CDATEPAGATAAHLIARSGIARKEKLYGCWQCDDFTTCENLKFLETNHGIAHLKNLRKLKRRGPAAFVKGKRHWYATK
ncbi:MAG: hypothetical protein JSW59_04145, partial [Phycisphaerales bacterium]